jgi:hypothetical protein
MVGLEKGDEELLINIMRSYAIETGLEKLCD